MTALAVFLALMVTFSILAASCGGGRAENRIGPGCSPSWSPDGSKIAFIDQRDFEYGVYIMDADGSNRTEVFALPVEIRAPSWSPDGTKIAFAAEEIIATVDLDGSNYRLAAEPGFRLLTDCPSWSPDGSKIAFVSRREGKQRIYVMNADGSNEIGLSPQEREGDSSPAWSPDGTKIAFDSYGAWHPQIYVMNADGSNPTRLTENTVGDRSPAWSPDGSRIGFISDRDGQPDLYTMHADGGDVTRLTENSIYEISLSWSPDGTRLAFCGEPDSGGTHIYVVKVPLTAP